CQIANTQPAQVKLDRQIEPRLFSFNDFSGIEQWDNQSLLARNWIAKTNQQMPFRCRGETLNVQRARVFWHLRRRLEQMKLIESAVLSERLDQSFVRFAHRGEGHLAIFDFDIGGEQAG